MAEFFRRIEKKYIINQKQYELLLEAIKDKLTLDPHGKSTICNLYFDTDNYYLIRHSLERPLYKDKVRIRSYNLANLDTIVYMEVKKKFNGIVSKRRISAPLRDIYSYLSNKSEIPYANTQVGKEIDYYFKYYNLHPTSYITYDRKPYYDKTDSGFRITFDTHIQARDYDLRLDKGIYGTEIFDSNKVLMEIKTLGGIPMWFTKFISDLSIRQGHFSKYGETYLQLICANKEYNKAV